MPARPPEDKIALYQALLDTHSEIEMKGKNMLFTSANGYMFSQLTKEGVLGLRLSKADQAAFLKKYGSGPFLSYGAVMKDYVTVPEVLQAAPDELAPWLVKSYDYVMSLEPK